MEKEFDDEVHAARVERVGQLSDIAVTTEAYSSVLEGERHFHLASRKVLALEAAFSNLTRKVKSNTAFKEELEVLRSASRGDALITAVLASLPSHIVNGTQTTLQLKQKFSTVAEAARVASRVSPDSGFTGKILALLSSKVSFAPSKEGVGDVVDDIIVKCNESFDDGDLHRVVVELSKLTGEAEVAVRPFVTAVRERVMVDMAVKAIRAQILTSSIALSA